MHFPRDLVRDFEKTAAKQFRYDAEADATYAPKPTRILISLGRTARP